MSSVMFWVRDEALHAPAHIVARRVYGGAR